MTDVISVTIHENRCSKKKKTHVYLKRCVLSLNYTVEDCDVFILKIFMSCCLENTFLCVLLKLLALNFVFRSFQKLFDHTMNFRSKRDICA